MLQQIAAVSIGAGVALVIGLAIAGIIERYRRKITPDHVESYLRGQR